MKPLQKIILLVALAALALTAAAAPYEWEGYEYLGVMNVPRTGVLHAPLWSPPETSPVSPIKPSQNVYVTATRLDGGKLALWWGGIALLAAVAFVITAPPGRRQ